MTDNVYINIGKHAVDRFLERSPQEAKVLGIVKDYGYNGFEELDNLRYNQFLLSEYFRARLRTALYVQTSCSCSMWMSITISTLATSAFISTGKAFLFVNVRL